MQGPLFRGSEQQGVLGSQQGKKKKKEEAAGCPPHFRLALRQWGPSLYVWGKTAAVGGREAGRVTSDLREPDWGIYHSQGLQCSGAGLSIHTHHFLDAKHHP